MSNDERDFRASRMKQAMDRAGLSSGQIAYRMNVTGAAVRGWVTGRRGIGPDELARFADVVDYPVSHFLRPGSRLPEDFSLRYGLRRLNELVETLTDRIGKEPGFRIAGDEEAIDYLRRTHNLSDEAVARIREIVEHD